MEEYTKEQIETWKRKAEKWDNLDERIGRHYDDDSESDLCNIGEEAAIAFGYL